MIIIIIIIILKTKISQTTVKQVQPRQQQVTFLADISFLFQMETKKLANFSVIEQCNRAEETVYRMLLLLLSALAFYAGLV